MTTRTQLTGNQWTLISTAPSRVLLQALGGDVEIYMGATQPDLETHGFIVKSDDWADFIKLEDFLVNIYARATGSTASVLHVESLIAQL